MRRALRIALSVAFASVGLLSLCPTAVADAQLSVDGECARLDQTTNRCRVEVTIPAAPTDPAVNVPVGPAAPGQDEPADPVPGNPCVWSGDYGTGEAVEEPVDCESMWGYWNNGLGCYISLQDPQPPVGAPEWAGRSPSDGAFYRCYVPITDYERVLFLDEPPEASGQGPTPGAVAQQAVAQMDLEAVTIGVAPQAPAMAVVGVPVWLWVASPGANSFGTTTATASAGGVTVSATASVTEIRWDLGDGTTITCGAGTPYRPEFGGEPSPDCGHVYTRESGYEPGRAYTVTATTTWVVQWVGAGQTGTITLDPLVAETQVVVAEGQVLVG